MIRNQCGCVKSSRTHSEQRHSGALAASAPGGRARLRTRTRLVGKVFVAQARNHLPWAHAVSLSIAVVAVKLHLRGRPSTKLARYATSPDCRRRSAEPLESQRRVRTAAERTRGRSDENSFNAMLAPPPQSTREVATPHEARRSAATAELVADIGLATFIAATYRPSTLREVVVLSE